jgi:potassium voltage-gated channel Shaker-related subfamily A protein 1/potassium voltage-gated channel Shaker-related subfamily A protein
MLSDMCCAVFARRIAGVLTTQEELRALEVALARVQAEEQVEAERGGGLSRGSAEQRLERARQLCVDPRVPPHLVLARYLCQVMNVIDAVAIVPFYIELGSSSGSSIAIVRVLRLARMLRIFKASKYNEGTKLLSHTIWRSLPALSLLFFFTALGVVRYGSLIFFMEGGDFRVTADFPGGAYLRPDLVGGQEVSPYASIPVACFWVIVTGTTVGFGDLYPTSGGGRFVACICMYIGLLVLALPITVVGSNFTMVYEVPTQHNTTLVNSFHAACTSAC